MLTHQMLRRSVLVLLLLPGLARGSDADRLWTGKVRQLFDVQCVKCHGPIEQKGGLELDTPQAVLKGGDDGVVIVPGKPEESSLYKKLEPGADPHMPPKKQLSETEREWVRQWIQGLSSSESTSASKPGARRDFQTVTQAIDTLLAEAWQRNSLTPAAEVDEKSWCRRVYLDAAGRIPSTAEVEEFLASPAQSRREALVDRLLSSSAYAVRMRELWDIFLMGRAKRAGQEDKRRQNGWWTFLETSFKNNRPWNETVRTFLIGRTQSPQDKGANWFLYERKNEHQAIAEAVAPVVYGTKIDCAQCHDHPLAREIKQAHYWGLVAAFNRSKNVEGTPQVAEQAVGGFVNFTNPKKESQPALITLLTGRTLSESWPANDQKEEDSDDKYIDPKAKVRIPKYSRREAFADLATFENPLLAKAFVNRMWAVFLGRGMVDPADEINARNAPSTPDLLDWLSEDFSNNRHDAKRLVRGILLSRAYALGQGSEAAEFFSGSVERPLTGEQLARSWRIAMGLSPDDEALRRAAVLAIPDVLPRQYTASFQQAHFMTSAPAVVQLLKPTQGGTLARLGLLPDLQSRVNGAFEAVYGRPPDKEELAQTLNFLSQRKDLPTEALRDLLWALLTSAEFLTTP